MVIGFNDRNCLCSIPIHQKVDLGMMATPTTRKARITIRKSASSLFKCNPYVAVVIKTDNGDISIDKVMYSQLILPIVLQL